MTSRAFRGSFELNVHSVTAPGTYLAGRNDIYLSIRLLGQYKETRLSAPIFPLIFHERMDYEKTYYLALDHYHAVELLAEDEVYMELIQLSDLYERGVVLATYSCNTRDFLYPYSSSPPTYATDEREVLMRRTPDFPGIAPKIEFSCRAVVRQLYPSVLDDTLVGTAVRDELAASRRARSLSRSSRPRARSIGSSYTRPTLSAIYRSRSPSASKRLSTKGSEDDDRPPFVVRKLDTDLTTRVPGADDASASARRARSRSPSATRSLRARSVSPSRYRASSMISSSTVLGQCKICLRHASGLDCTLCRLHRKNYGLSYPGHVWCHYPEIHRKVGEYLSDTYTDPLYPDYYRDYLYRYPSRYYDGYHSRYYDSYRYPNYPYSYYRDLYGNDSSLDSSLALDLALARSRRSYYY